MTLLSEHFLDVDGVPTRYLAGGSKQKPAAIFLQSAAPGAAPYCGGAHIWGKSIEPFARNRYVVALDSLGSGGTAFAGVPTVEAMAAHLAGFIKAAGLGPVHLVGHDLGGLVALQLAMEQPALLASLSIVSSVWASPTGDAVENYTLRSPPVPLWGEQSQSWAFDRMSYSHHHIDTALLSDCSKAAEGAAHKAAVRAMGGEGYTRAFMGSAMKAKSRFFRQGREAGFAMPIQVVWAKHDLLSTVDQGLWTFRIVAAKQRAAQFHIINRAGTFCFREQPDEFYHIVSSFQEGLMEQVA